jgi:hypothetical protein
VASRLTLLQKSSFEAIFLMLAGAVGLAYGSFSYTKKTDEVKLGPIELSIQEKQR